MILCLPDTSNGWPHIAKRKRNQGHALVKCPIGDLLYRWMIGSRARWTEIFSVSLSYFIPNARWAMVKFPRCCQDQSSTGAIGQTLEPWSLKGFELMTILITFMFLYSRSKCCVIDLCAYNANTHYKLYKIFFLGHSFTRLWIPQ